MSKDDLVRIRVLLSFYLHVSEGAGFYEIPKKMMLTIEGNGNNLYPFQKLVKKHQKTGEAVAPNANAIMKNMMGHAYELGLQVSFQMFSRKHSTVTLGMPSRMLITSSFRKACDCVSGMAVSLAKSHGLNWMH